MWAAHDPDRARGQTTDCCHEATQTVTPCTSVAYGYLAVPRRGEYTPGTLPPQGCRPPPQAVKVDGHYAWQREPRPGTAGVHRSRSITNTIKPWRSVRPPQQRSPLTGEEIVRRRQNGGRARWPTAQRGCAEGAGASPGSNPRAGLRRGTGATPPADHGRLTQRRCPGGQRPRHSREVLGGGQRPTGAARQVNDPDPNPHPPPDTPQMFCQ